MDLVHHVSNRFLSLNRANVHVNEHFIARIVDPQLDKALIPEITGANAAIMSHLPHATCGSVAR
jgi:hypothetical protein